MLTGGEPLLQVDAALLDALHAHGFEIAVDETNGSVAAPSGIDLLCVSPKAGAAWVQARGDESKLVCPQPGLMPGAVGEPDFSNFLLQPMDGPLCALPHVAGKTSFDPNMTGTKNATISPQASRMR